MSLVSSSLSRDQQMKLASLLGSNNWSLLYKATIHGFAADAFHMKCDKQGPTVVVAYNQSGYVFGAYTSKDYAKTGKDIADDKAFLFSISRQSGQEGPLRVVSGQAGYAFTDGDTGPNFKSMVFLHNDADEVFSAPAADGYNFKPAEMHGNDLKLTECEVYRVETHVGVFEKPWRNIQWSSEEKKRALMETITDWRPVVRSVRQARILLVGSVGAGKSSFFNSVSSVFRGHVTSQANTGTARASLTTQFRNYTIRTGQKGKSLPFILCDTMGMEEGYNGLELEDVTTILKGQMLDKYQFNPLMPLQPDSLYFRKAVELKDKIHAVVFVIDSGNVKLMLDKFIGKFATLRQKANQMGVPQLVLLTKVDEACPLVADDLKNVYRSQYIERTMREVSSLLGVSLTAVVPVKNYCQELELITDDDILILTAVNQILRVAEGYFNDMATEDDLASEKDLYSSGAP